MRVPDGTVGIEDKQIAMMPAHNRKRLERIMRARNAKYRVVRDVARHMTWFIGITDEMVAAMLTAPKEKP